MKTKSDVGVRGGMRGGLEDGIDNLVNYLIEVFLLDAAEAAQDARIDSDGQNLTFDIALLFHLEREHIVAERIGVVAAVGKILRGNQRHIDETLVKLQFVVRDYQCGVYLVALAGDWEVNLHNIFLMVLHFNYIVIPPCKA